MADLGDGRLMEAGDRGRARRGVHRRDDGRAEGRARLARAARFMTAMIRILLTKPTHDCHDRGVRYLAKRFRDESFEVVFTNFLLPAEIVATAVQEDVDVIGISSSSGGHLAVFEEVMADLPRQGLEDVVVIARRQHPAGGRRPAARVGRPRGLRPGVGSRRRRRADQGAARSRSTAVAVFTAAPATAPTGADRHAGVWPRAPRRTSGSRMPGPQGERAVRRHGELDRLAGGGGVEPRPVLEDRRAALLADRRPVPAAVGVDDLHVVVAVAHQAQLEAVAAGCGLADPDGDRDRFTPAHGPSVGLDRDVPVPPARGDDLPGPPGLGAGPQAGVGVDRDRQR